METKTKASTGQQNFLLMPGQLVETCIATRILTLEHRELSKVTLKYTLVRCSAIPGAIHQSLVKHLKWNFLRK